MLPWLLVFWILCLRLPLQERVGTCLLLLFLLFLVLNATFTPTPSSGTSLEENAKVVGKCLMVVRPLCSQCAFEYQTQEHWQDAALPESVLEQALCSGLLSSGCPSSARSRGGAGSWGWEITTPGLMLMECLQGPKSCSKSMLMACLNKFSQKSFAVIIIPSHFIDEEMEAQRSDITCPGSHIW